MGWKVSELASNKEDKYANRYGDSPFINADPTNPNLAYWKHVDWVVARAAHYGLRISMHPTYGSLTISFSEGDRNRLFDARNAAIYARWLGARYRNSGIIWVLGGDTLPLWAVSEKDKSGKIIHDFSPIYDAMANGLLEGERGDPFITYHPSCCSWPGTAEPRTSLYLGNRDWLDMNMIQSSHFIDPSKFLQDFGFGFGWRGPYNYQAITSEYNSLPFRPVIDGEPASEDIPDTSIAVGPLAMEGKPLRRFNAYDDRMRAYHSVFAGAGGHTLHNVSITISYDPSRGMKSVFGERVPWREALSMKAAEQLGYVRRLMLSRPYFSRIPDQSVIVDDAGEGETYISATRDREGSYMMIYLPQGQPVTVDMNKLSGLSANGWWYDPRTGQATHIEGSFPANRQQRFTPPSSGPENDWILVLDDASKGFGYAIHSEGFYVNATRVFQANSRRQRRSGDIHSGCPGYGGRPEDTDQDL